MKGRGARARRIRGREGARIRQRILNRDGWRCRQCGKRGRLEVDHITPLWRNGAEADSNRQALCAIPCHRAKTRRECGRVLSAGEKAWLRFRDELRQKPVV